MPKIRRPGSEVPSLAAGGGGSSAIIRFQATSIFGRVRL
jgi:hypothetical protein